MSNPRVTRRVRTFAALSVAFNVLALAGCIWRSHADHDLYTEITQVIVGAASLAVMFAFGAILPFIPTRWRGRLALTIYPAGTAVTLLWQTKRDWTWLPPMAFVLLAAFAAQLVLLAAVRRSVPDKTLRPTAFSFLDSIASVVVDVALIATVAIAWLVDPASAGGGVAVTVMAVLAIGSLVDTQAVARNPRPISGLRALFASPSGGEGGPR